MRCIFVKAASEVLNKYVVEEVDGVHDWYIAESTNGFEAAKLLEIDFQ